MEAIHVPPALPAGWRPFQIDRTDIHDSASTLTRAVPMFEGDNPVRKITLVATIIIAALTLPLAGLAKPPQGAVRGTFTIGILAQGDALTKYMRFSNVFCVWSRDHVIVHVSAKNTSAEHVTATISPKYWIARGGPHGDGFGSQQDKGFDGGEFRSLWLDAGKPKGVPAKTPIAKCTPYLFSIKSG